MKQDIQIHSQNSPMWNKKELSFDSRMSDQTSFCN